MASKDYKYIYSPDHPHKGQNNCVYEHVLNAEKKLGRYLKDGECVHHIDENKKNNNPNNLMVFDSIASHSAFHHGRKAIKLEDGTYTVETMKQTLKICPICKINKLSYGSSMCLECYNKKHSQNIPSKNQLINDFIDNNSNKSAVSRIYNVSQKAVNKWCKRYKIKDCLININMSKPTKKRERIWINK